MNTIQRKTVPKKRDQFTSNSGFILSCVGAALGLGNIWMFSYKLGKYGGAAFLIPYFLFVFVLGTTGLITEFTFGRMYKTGSFTSIKRIFKEKKLKGGAVIGIFPTLAMIGVFMFYSIVIGWILKYLAISITGGISSIDTPAYFEAFAGTSKAFPWFVLAVLLTVTVISLGISKGIEKLNRLAMPLILVLFLILLIRSLTLPGAMVGVRHLIYPKWDVLCKIETWVMALGQAFFTVSLSGCALVVYGSYTCDTYDIPKSAILTAFFDTIAALLASFIIIPAVYALGLNPTAGPALLFITVPKIFQSMPYGSIVSTLFFFSIIFAAISSSINLLEGPVEAILSSTKLSRKKVSAILGGISILLALPLVNNMMLFEQFTNLMTIVITPLGILLVSLIFFFGTKPEKVLEEVNKGAGYKLGKWFVILGKYIFTITTIVVILLGILYGGIG